MTSEVSGGNFSKEVVNVSKEVLPHDREDLGRSDSDFNCVKFKFHLSLVAV